MVCTAIIITVELDFGNFFFVAFKTGIELTLTFISPEIKVMPVQRTDVLAREERVANVSHFHW